MKDKTKWGLAALAALAACIWRAKQKAERRRRRFDPDDVVDCLADKLS